MSNINTEEKKLWKGMQVLLSESELKMIQDSLLCAGCDPDDTQEYDYLWRKIFNALQMSEEGYDRLCPQEYECNQCANNCHTSQRMIFRLA